MDVTVPEIGESVTEGVLTSWLKQDGSQVSEGDDLFELETDKATLAVPAPGSGVLHVRVGEETDVAVGQVVGTIEEGAVAAVGRRAEAAEPERPPGAVDDEQATPAARVLLDQHGIRPDSVPGTGKDGRITKGDVLQALEERKGAPPAAGEERESRERLSSLRRRMAENLLASVQNAAYVTTFNEIDMFRVIALRKTYGEPFLQRHDARLGFMSFFVRAVCAALREHPIINARLDGEEIVYHRFFHIGIAVSTDRGLVVPVIRDADTKSFARIESEIRSFAKRAAEKKLSLDELTGGTFSITNGGVFGSLLSTPLPNPPQPAILGMHAITPRPVAVEGEPVVRPMMYTALTYDHRIIEGREAVSFLRRVRELVEDPERLLLDT